MLLHPPSRRRPAECSEQGGCLTGMRSENRKLADPLVAQVRHQLQAARIDDERQPRGGGESGEFSGRLPGVLIHSRPDEARLDPSAPRNDPRSGRERQVRNPGRRVQADHARSCALRAENRQDTRTGVGLRARDESDDSPRVLVIVGAGHADEPRNVGLLHEDDPAAPHVESEPVHAYPTGRLGSGWQCENRLHRPHRDGAFGFQKRPLNLAVVTQLT